MKYLFTNSGFQVAQGEDIYWSEDLRAWVTPETNFSDFNGNAYILSDTPGPLPVVIPQSITRAQAKLALLGAGLLGNVQPTIDAITDPTQRTAAQIEWDDRLTFERNNQTLIALATAMGMTSEQLDNLFIAAANL